MSSDYLFAQPSFFRGFGRVFDPFGIPEPYNWSRSPAEADSLALFVDWAVVGKDLANALAVFSAPDPNQLPLFDAATSGVNEPQESR